MKVNLVLGEDQIKEVPRNVLELSLLVKEMLIDDDDEGEVADIPLPNISYVTMKQVLQFCDFYVNHEPLGEITKPLHSSTMADNVNNEWYATYIDLVEDVPRLVLAANYLDIASLVQLGCAKIATLIMSKTEDEVIQQFHIIKDPVINKYAMKKEEEDGEIVVE